jgi:hypothetical protein
MTVRGTNRSYRGSYGSWQSTSSARSDLWRDNRAADPMDMAVKHAPADTAG